MKVYVHKDGKQYGPYPIEQLRQYVEAGNFTLEDLACHDGQNWVTIAEVPGFAVAGDSLATPQQDQAVKEKPIEQQPAAANASNSPAKKKKIILWTGIGGVVTLLAVGLLTWLLGGDEGVLESNQSSAEPLDAKTAGVGKIDLDDSETLDEIIAEAAVGDELEQRGKEGEGLSYARNEQKPYTGWNVIFHDNGQINHLIQYKNGKYDGLWVTWYESGQKKGEANYKDGKSFGLQTYWYENGQKQFEANYKEGKKDGLWTSWYVNGQKEFETNFKEGKKAGLGTSWYENGQKEIEGNWENDQRNGLWTFWYENGQKREEGNWKDGQPVTVEVWKPNGEKCPDTNVVDGNGVWVGYAENGQKVSESNYKEGKWDGPNTSWNPNGQKMVEENYKNGKLNGLGTRWYPSGQKQGAITFKDDKKAGLATYWHENGRKHSEGNWDKDQRNGLWVIWYENGQKEEEASYKAGKLWAAVAWKPNGEKCPATNLVNGNGIRVLYKEDGTEWGRSTFREGTGVIDGDKLQLRSKEGEELYYAPNQETPYTGWAKLTYDNGQVESLTQYKDGQQDGPETKWYENGQKMAEGNFKDGQLNGLWTSWYPSGQKQSEENFKDSELNGLLTNWYENGQKSSEVTFKDGKWDGLETSWYPSGQKQGEGNFKDGKQDGLWSGWHENGQKSVEENWKDGKLNGPLKSWYESGQMQEEGNWHKDELNGLWVTWYENGRKQKKANFKDGKQDGLGTNWYENGQMQGEASYKDGEQDGPAKSWHENGRKHSEGSWDKDERNGLWVTWYENGQMQKKANFKDGEQDGLGTSWFENGQMQGEANYKDGKLMSAEAWMPNGEKCPHTKVVNGHGVVVGYAENGRKSVEGNFKDGKKDGLWVNWYESGQKKREETFKDHKLWTTVAWMPNGEKCPHTKVVNGNGVVVGYAENGRKSVEGNFKDGKQDGTWILYNEDGTEDFRITYKDGERVNGARPALDNRSDPIEDSFDHSDSPSPLSTLVAPEAIRVEETPKRKTAEFTKIDLDDPKTLNKIIAEAIDFYNLKYRGKEGEGLVYAANQQTPYTGWGKGGGYRNGQIGSLTQWKSGKKDGVSIEWYGNGQKKSEVTYKDGKLMVAVAWKPNGEKCPVTNLRDGNGVRVVYEGNGAVSQRENYKDGLQHGTMISYNHDGTERWRENYKDGVQVGSIYYRYYSNGQKRWRETYKDGKLVVAVAWKPNGKKCPVTKIDEDGNGVRVHYHESGQKEEEVNYKDGLRNGPMISYNHDGSERWRENYKDGVKVGSIWYNPDGTESWRATYKDGVKVGSINYSYYSNRQKKSEVTERNGKTMTVVAWKPNGEKCPVTKIDKDGNGVEVSYNPDGTESCRFTYRDGVYEPPLLLKLDPHYPIKPFSTPKVRLKPPQVLSDISSLDDVIKAVDALLADFEEQTAQVGKIDLDDPATRNRIIAEAIDRDRLQKRGKDGGVLIYVPNEQTPYTGWVKWVRDNGQLEELGRYKDGKEDGMQDSWYEDGQKAEEIRYKDGKLMVAVAWKPNGEKCPHTNVVNGNGVWVKYTVEGRETLRITYKNGVQNGPYTERYPNGRIHRLYQYKNGKLDGLLVSYLEDGTEYSRLTYKDGKRWVPRGQSSLQLSAAVQFLNGEVRPAGDVEFFVLREDLETVVKKAGVDLPVEQGISSAAELWARSVRNRDRYPGVAAQIRNALAGSSSVGIKTDASGSASVSFLGAEISAGSYFLVGVAPLGSVGVVWSRPFEILSSTETTTLKLDLRDAIWAQ